MPSLRFKKKFGYFVNALQYGTPPHAGMAFGLDRLAMILGGTDNIRDVIAFPKNLAGVDPMSMAPTEVTVKGTHDIIGGEAENYSYVENVMSQIASFFAFKQVRPPVLEHSELFVRGVGESSDVVRKEMYTFDDKGGRSLTLRPEFTAGIMRLIVQNKLLPIR